MMFSDCGSFNQSLKLWNIDENKTVLNGLLNNCVNYTFKNELNIKFSKKVYDRIFLNYDSEDEIPELFFSENDFV